MKTDGKIFQVATRKPARKEALPRLPHERDESDDSQQSEPRSEIRQASRDARCGMRGQGKGEISACVITV